MAHKKNNIEITSIDEFNKEYLPRQGKNSGYNFIDTKSLGTEIALNILSGIRDNIKKVKLTN